MSRQSDQDRALDRLLRAMPGEPAEATAACIDAERLAAWSEGGLSPAERDSIDAHIASCGRCLAMLAVLSDTAAAHEGPVPVHDVRQTPRGSRWWRPPIRWLVPITTMAAAVVIWMVLPARPPAPAFSPTSQVARDEAAPAVPSPDAATQPVDGRAADRRRDFALSQEPASPTAPPPQALSKAVEPVAEGEPRRQERNVQESVRVAEEPAAKPTDAATPARQGAANEAVSDRTAARAAAPLPPAAAPAAALQRAVAPTIEISSPDPTYRWRIRGMAVERSTSGGSSWQPAAIPAGATVNGGTAPGPNVCWLIGPAGTVLWTSDGSRFEPVSIPGAGALVSIQATDANRATVTAADKQVYVTADGGRTWTR